MKRFWGRFRNRKPEAGPDPWLEEYRWYGDPEPEPEPWPQPNPGRQWRPTPDTDWWHKWPYAVTPREGLFEPYLADVAAPDKSPQLVIPERIAHGFGIYTTSSTLSCDALDDYREPTE